MDKNDGYLIIPRGFGKSSFAILAEIDFLYRSGRMNLDDYLNFTGEALICLFGMSEEFVKNWKTGVRKKE